MSESIDILISADDRASGKILAASSNMENLSAKVKENARATKASTELFGAFARSLGGTELGTYASELAQMTEKVGAFSEVSKAGRLGALAFQAGILAAAGVATFKLTEGIASWWMELDKAKKSADEAAKAFERASVAIDKAAAKRQSMEREDFSLIRDPGEREAAINARAAEIDRIAGDANAQAIQARERLLALEQKAASEFRIPGIPTATDADIEVQKDQLQAAEARRDALKEEAESLRELTSQRTKDNEAKRQANSAADKSEEYLSVLQREVDLLKASGEEHIKVQAIQSVAPEYRSRAEELLKERDALKASVEAEKESKLQAEERARWAADLEKRELQAIEEKRIELEKGKEAAAAYRLEQQGLTKDVAESIAAKQAELEQEIKAKAELAATEKIDQAPQQAVQGRLLTRGTGGDIQGQILSGIKQLVKVTQDQFAAEREFYRQARDKTVYVNKLVVP